MVNPTSTGTGDNPEYCASRLPCGVCMILNAMCPKWGYTITPSWTGGAITTQAGTETGGSGATYDVKTGQFRVINDG